MVFIDENEDALSKLAVTISIKCLSHSHSVERITIFPKFRIFNQTDTS